MGQEGKGEAERRMRVVLTLTLEVCVGRSLTLNLTKKVSFKIIVFNLA